MTALDFPLWAAALGGHRIGQLRLARSKIAVWPPGRGNQGPSNAYVWSGIVFLSIAITFPRGPNLRPFHSSSNLRLLALAPELPVQKMELSELDTVLSACFNYVCDVNSLLIRHHLICRGSNLVKIAGALHAEQTTSKLLTEQADRKRPRKVRLQLPTVDVVVSPAVPSGQSQDSDQITAEAAEVHPSPQISMQTMDTPVNLQNKRSRNPEAEDYDFLIICRGSNTPFRCNLCAKRFRRRADFNRHACIHTNGRRYTCESFRRLAAVII